MVEREQHENLANSCDWIPFKFYKYFIIMKMISNIPPVYVKAIPVILTINKEIGGSETDPSSEAIFVLVQYSLVSCIDVL